MLEERYLELSGKFATVLDEKKEQSVLLRQREKECFQAMSAAQQLAHQVESLQKGMQKCMADIEAMRTIDRERQEAVKRLEHTVENLVQTSKVEQQWRQDVTSRVTVLEKYTCTTQILQKKMNRVDLLARTLSTMDFQSNNVEPEDSDEDTNARPVEGYEYRVMKGEIDSLKARLTLLEDLQKHEHDIRTAAPQPPDIPQSQRPSIRSRFHRSTVTVSKLVAKLEQTPECQILEDLCDIGEQSTAHRAELRRLRICSISLGILENSTNSILRCCALRLLECLAIDLEGVEEICEHLGPLIIAGPLKVDSSTCGTPTAGEVWRCMKVLGTLSGTADGAQATATVLGSVGSRNLLALLCAPALECQAEKDEEILKTDVQSQLAAAVLVSNMVKSLSPYKEHPWLAALAVPSTTCGEGGQAMEGISAATMLAEQLAHSITKVQSIQNGFVNCNVDNGTTDTGGKSTKERSDVRHVAAHEHAQSRLVYTLLHLTSALCGLSQAHRKNLQRGGVVTSLLVVAVKTQEVATRVLALNFLLNLLPSQKVKLQLLSRQSQQLPLGGSTVELPSGVRVLAQILAAGLSKPKSEMQNDGNPHCLLLAAKCLAALASGKSKQVGEALGGDFVVLTACARACTLRPGGRQGHRRCSSHDISDIYIDSVGPSGACAIAEFASLTLARVAKYIPATALEQLFSACHSYHSSRVTQTQDILDPIHTALKHTPSERVQHRLLATCLELRKYPAMFTRLSEPGLEFDVTIAQLADSPNSEVAEIAKKFLQ